MAMNCIQTRAPCNIDDTELGSSRENAIPIDDDSCPPSPQAERPAERAISALSGSPQSPTGVYGTQLAPPRSAAEHVLSDSEHLHSRMGSVYYESQHAYSQTDGQNPCGIEHVEDRETDGDTEIASTPGESYLGIVAGSFNNIMDDLPTRAQEDTGSRLFSPGNECQVTMCPTTTGNPELCHEQNTIGNKMDASVMTVNHPTDETVSNTAISVGAGSHDREIPGVSPILYDVAEESAHEAESVTDLHQHSYTEVPLAESREMSTPASKGLTQNATSSPPRAREAEAGANHDTTNDHQEPSNIECHSPEVGQAQAVINHEPSDDYAWNSDLELGKRAFQERAASEPELGPRSSSRLQSKSKRATRKRAAPVSELVQRRSSRLQGKRALV